MLDFRRWVKVDIHDEAAAKAVATKTINSQEPTHPFFDTLMQYMDEQSTGHKQTKIADPDTSNSSV